ncbi:MAG: hopanoid biosynthesis associated radical SAM protein HpnH [Planctomycetes bacterium]|nr:hopanoid biosynthesis associated radical SAM protein HpnH [Planctomycetota bacterium]
MRFPLHITLDMVRHQVRQAWRRNKRYPFVVMIEPLYTCNLACLGCSTERHTGKLDDRLPLERCLQAVDVSEAPVVSICGGEPTLYPELKELVEGIIARRRHIYLCTNALVLEDNVFGKVAPHRRLTINVHLDGMRETHDEVCARTGVFDKAVRMMKEAKRLGYHVITNTTVFKETKVEELEKLARFVTELGVDGMLVSPGYQYESVDREMFLVREEIREKFKHVLGMSKRFRLQSTPMFLEFAAGLRNYDCSPWSTVTFTPKGWKGPCYLIGKEYYDEWESFWTGVDWDYWESRKDRLCQNCAMHSGFEASVVTGLRKSPKDMARMAAWNFFG